MAELEGIVLELQKHLKACPFAPHLLRHLCCSGQEISVLAGAITAKRLRSPITSTARIPIPLHFSSVGGSCAHENDIAQLFNSHRAILLVQEMEEAQRDLVAQAEARAEKAESEAAAEKEQRKRIMEAAANGALPLAASSPGRGLPKDMHVDSVSVHNHGLRLRG